MEESRWGGEKEVELKRMTDKIKNKCYVGVRGVYTTQTDRKFSICALKQSTAENADCCI